MISIFSGSNCGLLAEKNFWLGLKILGKSLALLRLKRKEKYRKTLGAMRIEIGNEIYLHQSNWTRLRRFTKLAKWVEIIAKWVERI